MRAIVSSRWGHLPSLEKNHTIKSTEFGPVGVRIAPLVRHRIACPEVGDLATPRAVAERVHYDVETIGLQVGIACLRNLPFTYQPAPPATSHVPKVLLSA